MQSLPVLYYIQNYLASFVVGAGNTRATANTVMDGALLLPDLSGKLKWVQVGNNRAKMHRKSCEKLTRALLFP